MTKTWETSISYGVASVDTYMMKSMESYIPIFLNMERSKKTMKKNAKDNSPEEIKNKEAQVVEFMMNEYPTLMNSIKDHLNSSFSLFAQKQMDYGLGNVSLGGNKKLALLGVAIRLNDKIQRLLNILDKDQSPNNESLVDTAVDITNYGAIFNTLLKDEWKK
tara:strand:+ start:268 stop:753 length:486 start_codon:yes stop_codon:yes gene_type:complete